MKKLMIAAAAAALVGGAYAAAPCSFDPDPVTVTTNAAVYAWKFTGKTTIGSPVSTTVRGTPAGDCGFGGTDTTTDTCVLRVPGALAIQGYIYYCDNCCEAFKTGTSEATLAQFYMLKPYQAKIVAPTIKFTQDATHIIGRAANQYEAVGEATFDAQKTGAGALIKVQFAGLGSYNYRSAVVTSISGNFAGTLKSPYYVSRTLCAPADWWTCSLTYAGKADDPTVAYGTWSAKYNATASRRYRANGTTIAIPAWAR